MNDPRLPLRRPLAGGVCRRTVLLLGVVALFWAGGVPPVEPASLAAQTHGAVTPDEAQAEGGSAVDHGEEHGESIWALAARIGNFAILVGVLVYLLRTPLAGYLSKRGEQIREDLATAKVLRSEATAQLARIEQQMQALPGELETLRVDGSQEVAAMEARIDEAAATERSRLLEQAHREIDLHLRVAKRDLVQHAAALAVGLASDRIKRNLTPEDQLRLVDRYADQVSSRME